MSNCPDDNGSTDRQHFVKGAEVFVGGLSQSLTESKIHEVFSTCGEIIEIRMITDKKGNSKGYCFVRFSTKEAAARAVKDKAGIMLEGRKIGVLPSTEQNSLFIGKLPKDWNSDDFDRVVRQVFPDVVSVNLVMQSSDKGASQKEKNRGFGFVQFSSHAAAARAYKLGSRSDFVLGTKLHPTVKWVEEELELDPEKLSKVKVAFIRELPMDVSEGFLEKLFRPYGEIERVVLSKKGQSQVGFVHFASRQDLDTSIKEMHNREVQGPKSGVFKLEVEVARPMEKSKKRAREGTSGTPTNTMSQSKILKAEPTFISSGGRGRVLEEFKESGVTDSYEIALFSLPAAIQDRLLRILRLGIATCYEVDIRCLRSLKEIPESAAISVLDQFLLSGGDELDKGSYLVGLITKYQAKSLGTSQMSAYTSRANEYNNARVDLTRLPSRNQVPVGDSYSSHIPTSRYDIYSPRLSYLNYSIAPQSGVARAVEERNTSPVLLSGSSPSFGRGGVNSPVIAGASHQPTRSQVRFDPFTGEPYKFDPFTGEPIQPESLTRSSNQSLY